jgi:hypothetical protein
MWNQWMQWIPVVYLALFVLMVPVMLAYEGEWGHVGSFLIWLSLVVILPLGLMLLGYQVCYPEWVSAYMGTDQTICMP